MPKSRNRKGKKSASATKGKRDVVSMTPLMRDALLEQREAFIKKFGREPGPATRSSSIRTPTPQPR
jgi:hypothetical protein